MLVPWPDPTATAYSDPFIPSTVSSSDLYIHHHEPIQFSPRRTLNKIRQTATKLQSMLLLLTWLQPERSVVLMAAKGWLRAVTLISMWLHHCSWSGLISPTLLWWKEWPTCKYNGKVVDCITLGPAWTTTTLCCMDNSSFSYCFPISKWQRGWCCWCCGGIAWDGCHRTALYGHFGRI